MKKSDHEKKQIKKTSFFSTNTHKNNVSAEEEEGIFGIIIKNDRYGNARVTRYGQPVTLEELQSENNNISVGNNHDFSAFNQIEKILLFSRELMLRTQEVKGLLYLLYPETQREGRIYEKNRRFRKEVLQKLDNTNDLIGLDNFISQLSQMAADRSLTI